MSVDLVTAALTFGAGALVWSLRLRLAFRRDEVPTAAAPTTTTVDVSIIVPARNEAHNLPALLSSLARLDPAPREIIVVDDHSTDGTGELARAAGVRVVTPAPLPADWNGKPWACHAGAQVASGACLLFTDADTVHAPDSLGRALTHARNQRVDMVSVIPSHIVKTGWERLQGIFHLLLLIATGAGARRARGERRFAIGQYLLLSCDAYLRAGGHRVVRRRIAEDLALARAVVEAGGSADTIYCRDLLRVRMYPDGFAAFVRGWRRSFYDGLASAGALATLEVTAVIGGLLVGPIALGRAAIGGDVTGIALGGAFYVAACVAIAHQQRRLGEFSVLSAPLYPIFVIVFAVVSVLALVDRLRGAVVLWKGRQVLTE